MAQQTFASTYRADGGITISSGKRLSIENAADFGRCVRTALATAQTVTLEFDPEVEVDISILQTLCSACKTAAAEHKTLTYQGSDPASLRQLIVTAGAERLGPCRHNNGNPCQWFGGKR